MTSLPQASGSDKPEADRAQPKRVLVVGAGSIGSRHIRNLLELGADVTVFRYRRELVGELAKLGPVRAVSSLEEGLAEEPDAVAICNNPADHLGVALAAAAADVDMFIEKPLGPSLAGWEELKATVEEKSLVAEVGCMLRFHPNLVAMKRLFSHSEVGKPYLVHAHVGHDLRRWRPGTDYRSTYTGRRSAGGGLILDLIHEIDYLTWLFGEVRTVSATTAKLSDLEIEGEDVAAVTLTFSNGCVAQVALDCVSPIYHRGCRIVTSSEILEWDYTVNELRSQVGEEGWTMLDRAPDFVRNDMYVAEIQHFLGRLDDRGPAAAGLQDGIGSLRIALAAYEAADAYSVVSLE